MIQDTMVYYKGQAMRTAVQAEPLAGLNGICTEKTNRGKSRVERPALQHRGRGTRAMVTTVE